MLAAELGSAAGTCWGAENVKRLNPTNFVGTLLIQHGHRAQQSGNAEPVQATGSDEARSGARQHTGRMHPAAGDSLW